MARPTAKKSALSGSVIAPQPQAQDEPAEPQAEQPRAATTPDPVVGNTATDAPAPEEPAEASSSTAASRAQALATAKEDPGALRAFDSAFQSGKKPRKTTAQRASDKGKVPLGLYFPEASDLDEARRAFVTDFWEHDGPDTFVGWISQAIHAHADRTHAERAALTQERRETRRGVRGIVRKLDVAPELVKTVEDGIAEDRKELRRQITVAAWCNDAVMAAIAATKSRTSGELMEIDGRLPPRLRK